ncbi:MAG TPA: hypothetical protein VHZ04_03410 [Candidatus Paceibacterota bacterium]|jgi:hypothetical protein|nr:hypothetical protein [Candidatus Paceibacterota bacterium]
MNTRRWLIALIIIIVILAAGYVLFVTRFRTTNGHPPPSTSSAVPSPNPDDTPGSWGEGNVLFTVKSATRYSTSTFGYPIINLQISANNFGNSANTSAPVALQEIDSNNNFVDASSSVGDSITLGPNASTTFTAIFKADVGATQTIFVVNDENHDLFAIDFPEPGVNGMQKGSVSQNGVAGCATFPGGDGGEIMEISGNIVTVHERYLNATARIVLNNGTTYYDASQGVSVSSSQVITMGSLISVDYGEECGGNPPLDFAFSVLKDPVMPDIPSPAGWYSHRVEYNEIILTKAEGLPIIASEAEPWGYGEQIQASVVILSGSPQTWATLNIGNTSGTIGRPPSNEWGMLDGYQTIETEITMKNGDMFEYVIFQNGIAYVFVLYPYPNPSDMPIFQNMIANFAKSLSQTSSSTK